ncbi:hypothetical protein H2198_005871 [Neophaeococcomyces mojaviensis]|uniref:Uncharacterized protein n=1 Tax=Neophaeococcomyces mojaviensis TaxID=3383035 RepID=A0ACC3A4Z5_9EURO|nr:hypothetical protein H2198_005871 [Knufia sp. JES_112]
MSRSFLRLSAYLLFSAICLFNQTQAAPINLPHWLDPLVPVKGVSLRDEIICYSLPYGGIGFLSHLLTYWVILILGFGRKPYWPWSKLSSGKFDLCLALLQVIISVLIASFTISRCRSRWQFVLIAVWKLVLSVEVGIWGVSASLKAMEHKKQRKGYMPVHMYNTIKKIWDADDWTPYTLIFYAAGYFVGIAGLGSIVWNLRHEQNIRYITYAFFAATASVIFVCMTLWCCCCCVSGISRQKLFLAMVFSVVMVGALYSDWVLGDIAGSLVGIPAGDPAYLYWAYFIAKRLPLLMT